MLSSLLLSSSGRAELSRIKLGSGRAFKNQAWVGPSFQESSLGRVGLLSSSLGSCRVVSGLQALCTAKSGKVAKSPNSKIAHSKIAQNVKTPKLQNHPFN